MVHSSYFGSKIKKTLISCIFDQLKKARLYILSLDQLGLFAQMNQINDFLPSQVVQRKFLAAVLPAPTYTKARFCKNNSDDHSNSGTW